MSRFISQLQALNGPQCLSGLLAFTMAIFIDLLLIPDRPGGPIKPIKKACVHPTASTEWARRVHSVLVRPACVHHGQIRYPAKSFNFFEGKFRVYEACLQALNGPVGPIQCLSGLLVFTRARFITQL